MRSSVDLKIDEHFESLFQSCDRQLSGLEVVETFHRWVEKITLDGKPFTYHRHEYLRQPYQDFHPFQVERKATQMGLTSKAMLRSAYESRFGTVRDILYFFPSKTDVTEFSKGRFNPLINDNPSTIGKWIRDTDSANIKQIWNAFIYFRGMQSRVGMKSVPGDFVIIDELDEAPVNFVFWLKKRLSHSEEKRVWKLSNPTLPDYGIDVDFQLSDQRYWLLKCPKCGKYTCMEDTFPDCLHQTNGHYIRLCQHCRDAELDPAQGEWVAKKPSVTEIRGYQYSQLYSQFVTPDEIMDEWLTAKNISDFWNLTIGLPHVEAENRLTLEEVLALCGSDGIALSDNGPCSMGVDQGKDLHVVIGKKDEHAFGKIVHVGIYKDWEELDRLMRNFKVAFCVVDALPETRNARAFANRFEGKVYLSYYNEHQKSGYALDEGKMIVNANRTETLDTSHNEVMEEGLILPKRCEMTEIFAEHLHNVAKKLEENEKTGEKRYVYVRLGPDHFRHALNYECIARENVPDYIFNELH